MSGIYIHIPVCGSKCNYCDFYSRPKPAVDIDATVKAIAAEAGERIRELDGTSVETIYFGGGTPSAVPPSALAEIAGSLTNALTSTGIRQDIKEMTIEVNPDDVTEDRSAEWRDMGFNRVSMGVQSFDDGELRRIGRRHDSRTAVTAFQTLRRHFDNISLDLIYGLPGQTPDSWKRSLDGVLALRPEHLSAYSLMFEEGTPLTRMLERGLVTEAPEELTLAMFDELRMRTEEAGLRQYEISNFALPGFESRHNSSYWRSEPYLGLGPSAHSYDGKRTRRANAADIRAYTSYWLGKEGSEAYRIETLDDEELREEYVMTRMRTMRGIDVADFETRFGKEMKESLKAIGKRLNEKGLVEFGDNSLRLTKEGILLSDSVILELAM